MSRYCLSGNRLGSAEISFGGQARDNNRDQGVRQLGLVSDDKSGSPDNMGVSLRSGSMRAGKLRLEVSWTMVRPALMEAW